MQSITLAHLVALLAFNMVMHVGRVLLANAEMPTVVTILLGEVSVKGQLKW